MRPEAPLPEAAGAAAAALAGQVEIFEVFARASWTLQLGSEQSGAILRRENSEVGVACRVQKGFLVGFGRAASHPREAGATAARLALASLGSGHDPLPPRERLGAEEVPAHPVLSEDALEELFQRWRQDPARGCVALTLIRSRTFFHRSEGFTATWDNQVLLAQWHQDLAPGVTVAFRRAGRRPEELAPPSVLTVLREGPGVPSLAVSRGLRRVLLAPDVAAPLLVLLARHQGRKAHPSPAWDFWDLRLGPQAFLPMACDGEGYPSRNRPLLIGDPGVAQLDPQRHGSAAGCRGTVRVPWDAPPAPNPVHLWQRAPEAEGAPGGLAYDGLAALAPASEVVLEHGGRFRLLALVAELRSGRPAGHGVLVVSGTLPRLASSLVATVGPAEHLALGCVVSTPWLLVANLEVG